MAHTFNCKNFIKNFMSYNFHKNLVMLNNKNLRFHQPVFKKEKSSFLRTFSFVFMKQKISEEKICLLFCKFFLICQLHRIRYFTVNILFQSLQDVEFYLVLHSHLCNDFHLMCICGHIRHQKSSAFFSLFQFHECRAN